MKHMFCVQLQLIIFFLVKKLSVPEGSPEGGSRFCLHPDGGHTCISVPLLKLQYCNITTVPIVTQKIELMYLRIILLYTPPILKTVRLVIKFMYTAWLQLFQQSSHGPKGHWDGAPWASRASKETHEFIFLWFSWLVVLLMGVYAQQRRRCTRWWPQCS